MNIDFPSRIIEIHNSFKDRKRALDDAQKLEIENLRDPTPALLAEIYLNHAGQRMELAQWHLNQWMDAISVAKWF